MKKFLSAALALCLAFSLAACGGSGSSTPASTAPSGGTAGSGAAIKIGGIGPVTGSTAVYGNAVKTARRSPLPRSTRWAASSMR